MNILSILTQIHPVSQELQNAIASNIKSKSFKRKEFLLKAGQVCQNMWFIESGLVRCFYDKDDKEVCSWFMKEGDFIISVQSFFNQQASYETVQALEDTVVHYITYQQLHELYLSFPEFNIHGRVLTQRYYALCEDRLYAIRMHTAAERYAYLLQNYQELIKRVTNTDIASYLGITLPTLSRLKSKKSTQKASASS